MHVFQITPKLHGLTNSYFVHNSVIWAGLDGNSLSLLCPAPVVTWRLGAAIIWRLIHSHVQWLMQTFSSDFSWGFGGNIYTWLLCCLDFLITWWLGSHGKNPEKASQGPHCLLWHSLQSPIVSFPSHSTGQGITKVKGQEYCSVRRWKIQHAQTHRVVIYTIPSNSIISWKNIVCACVCPQYYTHELIVVCSCFYFFSLILNYNVIISP